MGKGLLAESQGGTPIAESKGCYGGTKGSDFSQQAVPRPLFGERKRSCFSILSPEPIIWPVQMFSPLVTSVLSSSTGPPGTVSWHTPGTDEAASAPPRQEAARASVSPWHVHGSAR